MRDWASGSADGPFRLEKETSTRAAWIGKCGSFPQIAIYRTAWPNPKPKLRIEKIEIVGERGIPGLLAVPLGRK